MSTETAATPTAARPDRSSRRRATWLLILLAPLIAEGAYSGISLPSVWLGLPLLVPMYGAGVLLIREVAVRFRTGWPGLLLLGLAYELAEDGLALQALTSPRLYTAADWGPRVLGLNTTYWQSQIGYHLVFTVLIPVALADLVFPRLAGRPYLGRGGLIGAGVAFVLGLAVVRVAIAGFEDPGYQAPWPAVAAVLAVIVVLVLLVVLVLPRRTAPAARPGPLPTAALAAVLTGTATTSFLALAFPLGHAVGHPAVGRGAWVLIPMAVALTVALAMLRLIARWAVTDGFTDRHRIGLIGGALVAHSGYALVSGIVAGTAVLSIPIGVVVIAATVLLLGRLARVRLPAG